jgi:hypothetical protein
LTPQPQWFKSTAQKDGDVAAAAQQRLAAERRAHAATLRRRRAASARRHDANAAKYESHAIHGTVANARIEPMFEYTIPALRVAPVTKSVTAAVAASCTSPSATTTTTPTTWAQSPRDAAARDLVAVAAAAAMTGGGKRRSVAHAKRRSSLASLASIADATATAADGYLFTDSDDSDFDDDWTYQFSQQTHIGPLARDREQVQAARDRRRGERLARRQVALDAVAADDDRDSDSDSDDEFLTDNKQRRRDWRRYVAASGQSASQKDAALLGDDYASGPGDFDASDKRRRASRVQWAAYVAAKARKERRREQVALRLEMRQRDVLRGKRENNRKQKAQMTKQAQRNDKVEAERLAQYEVAARQELAGGDKFRRQVLWQREWHERQIQKKEKKEQHARKVQATQLEMRDTFKTEKQEQTRRRQHVEERAVRAMRQLATRQQPRAPMMDRRLDGLETARAARTARLDKEMTLQATSAARAEVQQVAKATAAAVHRAAASAVSAESSGAATARRARGKMMAMKTTVTEMKRADKTIANDADREKRVRDALLRKIDRWAADREVLNELLQLLRTPDLWTRVAKQSGGGGGGSGGGDGDEGIPELEQREALRAADAVGGAHHALRITHTFVDFSRQFDSLAHLCDAMVAEANVERELAVLLRARTLFAAGFVYAAAVRGDGAPPSIEERDREMVAKLLHQSDDSAAAVRYLRHYVREQTQFSDFKALLRDVRVRTANEVAVLKLLATRDLYADAAGIDAAAALTRAHAHTLISEAGAFGVASITLRRLIRARDACVDFDDVVLKVRQLIFQDAQTKAAAARRRAEVEAAALDAAKRIADEMTAQAERAAARAAAQAEAEKRAALEATRVLELELQRRRAEEERQHRLEAEAAARAAAAAEQQRRIAEAEAAAAAAAEEAHARRIAHEQRAAEERSKLAEQQERTDAETQAVRVLETKQSERRAAAAAVVSGMKEKEDARAAAAAEAAAAAAAAAEAAAEQQRRIDAFVARRTSKRNARVEERIRRVMERKVSEARERVCVAKEAAQAAVERAAADADASNDVAEDDKHLDDVTAEEVSSLSKIMNLVDSDSDSDDGFPSERFGPHHVLLMLALDKLPSLHLDGDGNVHAMVSVHEKKVADSLQERRGTNKGFNKNYQYIAQTEHSAPGDKVVFQVPILVMHHHDERPQHLRFDIYDLRSPTHVSHRDVIGRVITTLDALKPHVPADLVQFRILNAQWKPLDCGATLLVDAREMQGAKHAPSGALRRVWLGPKRREALHTKQQKRANAFSSIESEMLTQRKSFLAFADGAGSKSRRSSVSSTGGGGSTANSRRESFARRPSRKTSSLTSLGICKEELDTIDDEDADRAAVAELELAEDKTRGEQRDAKQQEEKELGSRLISITDIQARRELRARLYDVPDTVAPELMPHVFTGCVATLRALKQPGLLLLADGDEPPPAPGAADIVRMCLYAGRRAASYIRRCVKKGRTFASYAELIAYVRSKEVAYRTEKGIQLVDAPPPDPDVIDSQAATVIQPSGQDDGGYSISGSAVSNESLREICAEVSSFMTSRQKKISLVNGMRRLAQRYKELSARKKVAPLSAFEAEELEHVTTMAKAAQKRMKAFEAELADKRGRSTSST